MSQSHRGEGAGLRQSSEWVQSMPSRHQARVGTLVNRRHGKLEMWLEDIRAAAGRACYKGASVVSGAGGTSLDRVKRSMLGGCETGLAQMRLQDKGHQNRAP